MFTGLERADVAISSDLWSYWVQLSRQISPPRSANPNFRERFLARDDEDLMDEDMRASRRRFLHRRKFRQIERWLSHVPDTLLQSIYQRLQSSDNDFDEDNVLMKSIQRALSDSPVASSKDPLNVLRNSEELAEL